MQRLIWFALILAGCSSTPKKFSAPSTSAAQGSVNQASRSNTDAQRYNDVAASDARLIDAKAAVIKKYWAP